MRLALSHPANPRLAGVEQGYHRALVGRVVVGERLVREALQGQLSGPEQATARLVLGLIARCSGNHDAAATAFREVLQGAAPDSPDGALGTFLLCDSLAQSGRLDELRGYLEASARAWPAHLSELCNGLLRLALGEPQEALQLVAAARAAMVSPGLDRWAAALHAELHLERADWGAAAALTAGIADTVETAFDECTVRLLALEMRRQVEALALAPTFAPAPEALAAARQSVRLCRGYATNMPSYRLVAEGTLALLACRGGEDQRGAVLEAAELLEARGYLLEAGRLAARLAQVLAGQQRERSTAAVARARDLLVRVGAFGRLKGLSTAEGAAPGGASVLASTTGAPRTTFAGTSLMGFEVERDVELQAMFDVARDVVSSRSVNEVLQRIVASAVKVLKAERGALIRRWPDGRLECVAAQGLPPSEVREGSNEISFGVVHECEQSGQAVLSDNALTDERFRNRGSVLASDLRSVACAPMRTVKQNLGFLYLDSTVKSRAFTPVTREMLAVFAAQAAVALENALAFEEIDGLTRGLEQKVEQRTQELQAANAELSATLEDLKATRLKAAEAQRDALEKEMRLAREIQMGAVPPRGRIETSAAVLTGVMEPASFCGGDFWAFGEVGPEQVFLLVGDVTGHGVASAMLTAVAKSCLDTLLATGAAKGPGEFLARLNDAIFASGHGDLQMTAWMGVLDRATRTLTYANAAQTFPIYVDLSQGLPRLELCVARGDTLGEEKGTRFVEMKRKYSEGGALILYTDGLVECVDASGKQWGESRLRRVIAEQTQFEASALSEAITRTAWAHFGSVPRDDDVTVVVANLK